MVDDGPSCSSMSTRLTPLSRNPATSPSKRSLARRSLSAVAIFTKDLGIASDVGRAANFPLPLAATALQMFLMTAAAGMGRDDDASVARLFAQIAGLELPEASSEA